MTTSSPCFPVQLLPCPGLPEPASQCLWPARGARLSTFSSATTMTLPPFPPSPPFGPPRGTLYSWRKLMQPSPPSPPLTKIVMRSRNMARKGKGEIVEETTQHRRSPGRRQRPQVDAECGYLGYLQCPTRTAIGTIFGGPAVPAGQPGHPAILQAPRSPKYGPAAFDLRKYFAGRSLFRSQTTDLFHKPHSFRRQIVVAGDEPFQFFASAIGVTGIDELRDEPAPDFRFFTAARPQPECLPICCGGVCRFPADRARFGSQTPEVQVVGDNPRDLLEALQGLVRAVFLFVKHRQALQGGDCVRRVPVAQFFKGPTRHIGLIACKSISAQRQKQVRVGLVP